MDSLTFLKDEGPVGPLYVLYGDEPFLKRRVLLSLRERALGPEGDAQSVATHTGATATFAEVFDELQTLPFFTRRRVVVVEEADPFVTEHRTQLERKFGNLPASGVLILEVKTWASNTRLAKMVPNLAAIECKVLKQNMLPAWCSNWAASQYQKQLPAPAAAMLVDYVGPEMGLLDQEILKCSIYVDPRRTIEMEDVDRLVGNNRSESIFKMFDAMAEGRTAQALGMFERALDQGEEPFKIMGAFNSQLRRLAKAHRLAARGKNLRDALATAGVPPFAISSSESLLRQLGQRRLRRLYDWLVEANLDLRGNSPLPERMILERFLVRLLPSEKQNRAV